ncbi:hypothetical protein EBR66_04615 [bacterium]|nr:hypothetical protein [bacterium]
MDAGKTAILLVGGGMKSAHGAGFLYALQKHLHLPLPHMIMGSSGDAGNALYFAAGQYEAGKRVWTEILPTSPFIFLTRFWRIMDVDYLVDTIFKIQEPLNITALARSSIEWIIPISHAITGATRYVSARDKLDPFEVLRAAKAMPLFFAKWVKLGNHYYVDGEMGSTLNDHIQELYRRGARRIMVVSHSKKRSGITLLERCYAFFQPTGLRKALIRRLSTPNTDYRTPNDAHIVTLFADKLPATFASCKSSLLCATYEQGITDALSMEQELRALFTRREV